MILAEICLSKAHVIGSLTRSRWLQQLICCQTRNKSSNATAANVKILTADDFSVLLGDEQRQRCMDLLRKLPPFSRPKMLPHNRNEKSSASVLIALCQERDTNEVSLLYTRRSRHLRSHSLQISFPGGKRDETDESYVDCALRETEEEIGLPRERIHIWGEANPIILPRTAAIVPVVGVVPDFHVSELKLNLDEVEEAFSIPINTLISPAVARHTQFRSGYSNPVFVVDELRIWGVTGYLTYFFLRCLLSNAMPQTLKTNIKYIRPYKLPPKLPHHHVEVRE
ncbi:nucleoside diphosphate-linked moiety X motif 8 [Drosophila navojoa]|nr:nucleoside diphosphate-linked moiety X motif 8 [Drosophila navojoa]